MYRQNTPAGEPEDAVPKHCHREGAIKGAVATQNIHHPLTLVSLFDACMCHSESVSPLPLSP